MRGATLLSLLLCATASMAVRAEGSPAEAYRLQPGDVLSVSVWRESELQGDATVRPDGAVAFPLAGELAAAGRTVEDVRADLESRFRRYVPDALVTVAVKAVAGNRIFVLGKVARPGDFVLTRPTDVMQALSLAGGTTPFADTESIRILRREGTQLVAIEFRYGEVERGRRLEQNILLRGGDTVVVP